MKVEFSVQGTLPPKKDGSSSMWGKASEVERVLALRRAAFSALDGRPPLRSKIKLSLCVHLPRNGRDVGDLDNFITGICDGLMAADIKSKVGWWDNLAGDPIHPTRVVAIVDDFEVVGIQAEKVIGQATEPWYEVTLEGE